jgi:hypothetical protein
MTKSPPRFRPSLPPTTIATSNDPQDQNSIKHPAQPAYTFARSKDSMPCSTQVNIEDPCDHTPVSSIAQPAHYQAENDVCTAFSNIVSFMNVPDRIHHTRKDDYPKHREVCQKALEDATSATATRSEVKTNLSQFDKVWSDLPGYIKMKNYRPDLTNAEDAEFEDLCFKMDYNRAKFEALALNPKGCTEHSKVDDSRLHGIALKGTCTLFDSEYLAFS